jgi:hypothetical protein
VDEYLEDWRGATASPDDAAQSKQHALLVKNRKSHDGPEALEIHEIVVQSPILKPSPDPEKEDENCHNDIPEARVAFIDYLRPCYGNFSKPGDIFSNPKPQEIECIGL